MSDKTPEEERKEAPQSGADAPVPAQPSDESAAPGDADAPAAATGPADAAARESEPRQTDRAARDTGDAVAEEEWQPQARPSESATPEDPAATGDQPADEGGEAGPRPASPAVVLPPRRPEPPARTASAFADPAGAPDTPAERAVRRSAAADSAPWGVQVASRRSYDEAEASYRALASRYPSLLGSRKPMIFRADLGDRGTFYRVRVAADSRGEAAALCQRLKAVGADCFIGRN